MMYATSISQPHSSTPMLPINRDRKLAEAVFESITEGGYAADQDVASAELSSAALESLSSQLDQARIVVKV